LDVFVTNVVEETGPDGGQLKDFSVVDHEPDLIVNLDGKVGSIKVYHH
jgi:hypothetical protein